MSRKLVVLIYPLLALCLFGAGEQKLPSLDSILQPLGPPSPKQGAASTETTDSGVLQDEADQRWIRISMDQVMQSLLSAVRDEVEEEGKLEFSSISQWRSLRLPPGSAWRFVTDDMFSPDTRGNWFPLVHLEVNGERQGSWRLPVRVALFREVYVANQRLSRGDIPTSPRVSLMLRDVYRERGNPVSAGEDLSLYEMAQPVSEGRLISWSDLNRRPLIRRGESVEVILENGPLTITLGAISLQDGIAGEQVTLRNLRSRREFTGIVDAPGRVRVTEI